MRVNNLSMVAIHLNGYTHWLFFKECSTTVYYADQACYGYFNKFHRPRLYAEWQFSTQKSLSFMISGCSVQSTSDCWLRWNRPTAVAAATLGLIDCQSQSLHVRSCRVNTADLITAIKQHGEFFGIGSRSLMFNLSAVRYAFASIGVQCQFDRSRNIRAPILTCATETAAAKQASTSSIHTAMCMILCAVF